jgi:hypothetical protein
MVEFHAGGEFGEAEWRNKAIAPYKDRSRQERSLPPSADFANVVLFCCFASIRLRCPGALS